MTPGTRTLPDLTSPRARAWLRAHIAWREANAAKNAIETHGAHKVEQTAAEKNDRAWARMSDAEKAERPSRMEDRDMVNQGVAMTMYRLYMDRYTGGGAPHPVGTYRASYPLAALRQHYGRMGLPTTPAVSARHRAADGTIYEMSDGNGYRVVAGGA